VRCTVAGSHAPLDTIPPGTTWEARHHQTGGTVLLPAGKALASSRSVVTSKAPLFGADENAVAASPSMNLMQRVLGAARDRACDSPHTPRAVLGNLSQQPRTPNAHTPATVMKGIFEGTRGTTSAAPAQALRVLADAPATEKPARRTGVVAQRRGTQSAVKSVPGTEPLRRSSRRAVAPLEPVAASMAHRTSRSATPALAEATAAEEQAVATLVAAAVERAVDTAAAVEVMKAMEATHAAAAKSPSMRRLKKQLKEAHLVRFIVP
jgi:hypothetical protein